MRPHLTCGMSPAIWDSLNAESNTLSRNLETPSVLWEVTELQETLSKRIVEMDMRGYVHCDNPHSIYLFLF